MPKTILFPLEAAREAAAIKRAADCLESFDEEFAELPDLSLSDAAKLKAGYIIGLKHALQIVEGSFEFCKEGDARWSRGQLQRFIKDLEAGG